MKIETLNEMDLDSCVKELSGIFEHSPWIAREALTQRPFSSADKLFQVMEEVVRSSTPQQKEKLIEAHPRLGGSGKLTKHSSDEQRQAGLRSLGEKEAADMAALNAAYERRFDLPFIIAVRGRSKQEICSAMDNRLKNSRQEEMETAIEEILKIARFRFDDLLTGHCG